MSTYVEISIQSFHYHSYVRMVGCLDDEHYLSRLWFVPVGVAVGAPVLPLCVVGGG